LEVVDDERNLLFGVFAVQLGIVSSQSVMAAAAAWAADRSTGVAERLLSSGAITSAKRALVDGLVTEAVRQHDGDVSKTLGSIAPNAAVFASFGGSVAEAPARPESTSDATHVTTEAPGRYDVHDELGRGGIGRVLVAFDRHLGRELAMKELLEEDATGSGTPVTDPSSPAVARFLREARVTGRLEHPSIVPVYELGQREDGAFYYTMRLVRGRTLASALREAAGLTARLRLLDHFIDLCQAIAYAHSRGVVHRDIKPDNVMLGEFGETVVLDWGLAKMRGQKDIRGSELARGVAELQDEEAAKTMAGSAIGTPAYMSPEQADGNIDQIDERSDNWGLGAVLFEILAGRAPFTGVNPYEIIGKVMREDVPAVATICVEAPRDLAAVADKALSRDPELRYQTAIQLADDVQAFTAGAVVSAYEYTAWEQIRRLAAKNKAAVLATLMTMVAIFGALLYSSIAYQAEKQARLRGDLALARSLVDSARNHLRERQWTEARIHAAQSLVVNPRHDEDADEAVLDAASIVYQTEFERVGELLGRGTIDCRAPRAHARPSPDRRFFVCRDPHKFAAVTVDPFSARTFEMHVSARHGLAVASRHHFVATGTVGDVRVFDRSFVETRWSAGEPVWALSWSEAVERLYAGTDGGVVTISSDGPRPFATVDHAVRSIATGSAGQVAAWDEGGRLSVWSSDGTRLATRAHPATSAPSLEFASNDRRIVVSRGSEPLVILDARTLEDRTPPALRGQSVKSHVVDGARVAVALRRIANVVVVDLESGETQTLSRPALAIAVGLRGDDLAIQEVGATPFSVGLYELGDPPVKVGELSGHTNGLFSIEHLDDERMLTIQFEGAAAVWRVARRRARQGYLGATDVRSLAAFDEGRKLAFGSDNHLVVWDVVAGKAVLDQQIRGGNLIAVGVAPDERSVYASTSDVLFEADLQSGEIEPLRPGRYFDVSAVDGAVALCLPPQLKLQVSDELRDSGLPCVGTRSEFSPRGRRLASAGQATIEVVDYPSLAPVAQVPAKSVSGMAFTPDGRKLLLVTVTGAIEAWQLEPPKKLWAGTQDRWINQVDVSEDGALAVTAGDDQTVTIYRVADGERLLRLALPTAVVHAVFVDDQTIAHPDGSGVWIRPLDFSYATRDPAELLDRAVSTSSYRFDGVRLSVPPWPE